MTLTENVTVPPKHFPLQYQTSINAYIADIQSEFMVQINKYLLKSKQLFAKVVLQTVIS